MAAQVINSWNYIKETIPNYEEKIGELLFRKIFILAPQVRGMFRFAKYYSHDSNRGEVEETMFSTKEFKSHSRCVISTIDMVIQMLSPDLDPLINKLHYLGAAHAKYGALPAHYAIVGRALLETLTEILDNSNIVFTNELKLYWARTYDLISLTMIEGSKQEIMNE